MTPAARIQAAIEMMALVLAEPRPADGVISVYFRTHRYIGSKDRAAISERLYRIMRSFHRLCWWLQHQNREPDARRLVLVDAVLGGGKDFESVAALFSGTQYGPDKLDEGEKKMVRALEGKGIDHKDMPSDVRFECPVWAEEALHRALGERFASEMGAMLHPAPLDIRVNPIKAERDEVLEQLQAEGVRAEAGKISPWAIRVEGRPALSRHPLFEDGAIEFQDEGSQCVALMTAVKPGDQAVDFCAGAGGKTLAMGAMMKNKGRIVALDVLGGRLLRAKERFRRAGLHNIETREMTSERDKWVKHHVNHFNVVLVDAPCTGTGTWRRDPDKRWRQLGPGLSELVPLQKNILDSACRLVRPGGRLVYATCSLLPDENEDQIAAFLKDHPDFYLEPLPESLKSVSQSREMMKLTPASSGTDGFFAASMIRKKT